MLKNKLQVLFLINAGGLALVLCFLVFQYFSHSEKIVYVDNAKLFEGFYMTKEMKKIGEKEFNARKTILDSLYSKLQSGNIADAERKSLMQHFIQEKEELEMFNQNFSAQESSKIWSRIQGYVDDFSKEKNYDLIIGSENKQAVLFASEHTDITNELLAYINKKYEGAQ